jgi:hypothetical protein
MTSPVPTISITTPDLISKDYMANSNSATPTTPDSPTVFDVVKEIENSEPLVDEALDLNMKQRGFSIDDEDEELDKPKTIKTFYKQKCILITGASGFIGKAVLWKLIHSLGDSIDKVFVILRQSRQRSPKGRFQDDILSNKV